MRLWAWLMQLRQWRARRQFIESRRSQSWLGMATLLASCCIFFLIVTAAARGQGCPASF